MSYSTREVARLLEMPEHEVRAYARAGLIEPERGPRGAYVYTFRDLVLLRTARSLGEAQVPHARIRRTLEDLRARLPGDRQLSELRIRAVGDEIVIDDAGSTWNPTSGQIQLDFEVAELSSRIRRMPPRTPPEAVPEPGSRDAEGWFERGVDLEGTDGEQARRAYLRAIELEPDHADALVNLGRLLHERGDVAHAAERYRRALAVRPGHATAAYNLGVALEDLGRLDEAIDAYRAALRVDDSLADAHYNLAGLYQKTGDRPAALRHLRTYRALAGGDR
ncbi:MAG TPA: tetratricopeptide repeat protein [Longimicrobiales bacterium]|nr:tetratricopeptide repeat protein [Longimicrobiales bacterium]